MSKQQRCSYCDDLKKEGHNYCRVCGFWFRKGFVQHVRVAIAYRTHERFCGYCGGKRDTCKC